MLVLYGVVAMGCENPNGPSEDQTPQDVLDFFSTPFDPNNESLTFVAAGTTEEIGGVQGIDHNIFAIDWVSAANDVSMAVYREASGCSVPSSFSDNTLPPCELIASNTSRDKPKFVEFDADPSDTNVLTATNNGPGDEMVRFAGN